VLKDVALLDPDKLKGEDFPLLSKPSKPKSE
jgi:hypothetical protein